MKSMSDAGKIKTAFARQTKALELRPTIGQGTAVTKVRVRDGLTCDIEEGPWKLVADMNEKWGGNGEGPNPGTYGRGALGSCLAIAYMMWAARLEVPIDGLEVEIHADYDTRGSCDVAEVPISYTDVRYVVLVSSPAPKEDVMRVLDAADEHCAYLDVFSRALPVTRDVRFREAE
jgi:uncharacterized OsmC-like protein